MFIIPRGLFDKMGPFSARLWAVIAVTLAAVVTTDVEAVERKYYVQAEEVYIYMKYLFHL